MNTLARIMLGAALLGLCGGPFVTSAKAYIIVVDTDGMPLFTVANGKPYPQIMTLKAYIKKYRKD